MHGITFSKSPFITSILAPHLERKGLPLTVYKTFNEFKSRKSDYTLLDGDDILSRAESVQEEIKDILSRNNTNIALTTKKDFRRKIKLLDMGFSYCLELPIATQVVIKSIENTVKSKGNQVRDNITSYGINRGFNYLINNDGRIFLSHRHRSVYLSTIEKSILDYLYNRSEFASRGELAYAGWKRFNVKPNTIIVTIKHLRRKLEYLRLPHRINNLYGFGYKLENKN